MRDVVQKSLKQEIENAFGNLALPRPKEIVGPTQGDKKGERRIRDSLTGRDWHTLEARFLRENWAFFCYLSDIGYRYYMPALLMHCLDEPSENNALVHSTLILLTPSYHSLYYEGKDVKFEYRTALFNPAQYGAVCSFLGYIFDTLPTYRTLSAQALKWGWNRQEHPALERSREFYRARHNYTYPAPRKRRIRGLVEQIRAAFAATPYPGDDRLCGSEMGDEPAEQALELRGLDWRTIHPELLADCYTALSFLSDEGFRYFLPAFLIADLMADSLQIYSNAEPVFHLTHGLAPMSEQRRHLELLRDDSLPAHLRSSLRKDLVRSSYRETRDRYAAFTSTERQAIIAYLQYLATHENYTYERESIEEALKNYWLPSVEQVR